MIWSIFGIMLLAGTLVVALPLLRQERRFSVLSASAIVAVVAISVAVYGRIGTPGAESAGGEVPSVDDMVASLALRLEENPDDVTGWKMLGRSYMQLQRYDQAVQAFEQALQRESDNAQTLADLGEAVLLDDGGPVAGRAAQLFESAIAAAPGNAKALFYGGIAAVERGDRALAADRWEALLATSPPPEVQDILRPRIAEWRGEAPAMEKSQPDAAPAGSTPAAGAVATIDVSLSDAAGAAVPADATVFVIARDPGQPSPPIAAVRRRVSELPDAVPLSDADAMIPGRALSAFSDIEIVARVSMSGGPIEQPGDWYGTIRIDTGQSRHGRVVIDRLVK
jgi:cytochrome c-type biogenesis protein CcmH